MKIEKVNDNQIRCTLTKDDLASREIKLSELAYGSEKTKQLFRDMMQQANFEFGFEAENIPLMIEAIPINGECIVLIITKVEDPEELDMRFSRFAPSVHEDKADAEREREASDPAEVMDLFRRLQDSTAKETREGASLKEVTKKEEDGKPLMRAFRFDSLSPLLSVAAAFKDGMNGNSILYKDNASGTYLLLISSTTEELSDFNRICNVLSEYGSLIRVLPSTPAYLEEHCDIVLAENALQKLSQIS